MTFTLKILDSSNNVLAQSQGVDHLYLTYRQAYNEGDQLCIETDTPNTYLHLQLEDTLAPSFVYMTGTTFTFPIPFGDKRISYSPKSFTGDRHVLSVRRAYDEEITSYRNLALNPIDHHTNTALYPHAHANVETRGEAVFAARNAINGNIASDDHGAYPFESWGINQQADAAITIDFGKTVLTDRLVLTLRADFPHDNYWKQVTVTFSDETTQVLELEKTGVPQTFIIEEKAIEWIKLSQLIKDENDPSPFPALTQFEVWGRHSL